MLMAKNVKTAAALISAASLLVLSIFSCIAPDAGAAVPDPLAPASAEATSHSITISGEVKDSDGFFIVSDFVAAAVNNATGLRILSDPFSDGRFTIRFSVPGFAQDNQTIDVQVLSPDGSTLYGITSVLLSNTNHTSIFPVVVSVANPPPNYNWLIVIVLLMIFSLIWAGYILFTKWLVGQAVLRRASDIMIQRTQGAEQVDGDEQGGSEDEEGGEEADDDEKDEPPILGSIDVGAEKE